MLPALGSEAPKPLKIVPHTTSGERIRLSYRVKIATVVTIGLRLWEPEQISDEQDYQDISNSVLGVARGATESNSGPNTKPGHWSLLAAVDGLSSPYNPFDYCLLGRLTDWDTDSGLC